MRILVTGPESTGKSTLCKGLAQHFGGVVVSEFAREYLDIHKTYNQDSLRLIATEHIKRINETLKSSTEFVFVDTALEVIQVWSEVKYGNMDETLQNMINPTFDLVLICYPNIPWVPDVQRERPNQREELFERIQSKITSNNNTTWVIDQPLELRLSQAIGFIQKKLLRV